MNTPGVVSYKELIAGHWYCIGFQNDDGEMEWGQIIKYEGREHHEKCPDWYDEDGNKVESLYDPFLRMPVSMDAADAYQKQS